MPRDSKLVWSDELGGDLRKNKPSNKNEQVCESSITLHLKRLVSGKGRTIIEITNLPSNKSWCKRLAKELKKALGTGGAYKDNYIEIHGEALSKLTPFLDKKSIKWKKVGG